MEAVINTFSVKAEEGYMGSHGFVGSNNKAWNFSNLSQVIRKALRDNLPVTKKSNINVKKGGGTYTTTIDVTIKLERDKFAKNWREAFRDLKNNHLNYWGVGFSNQIAQKDDEVVYYINREDYFYSDKLTQALILDRYFDWACDYFMGLDKCIDIKHLPEYFLTDDAIELIDQAKQIVLSFNSDHGNSMVDYFDRDFYETIYIEWI